jgi:hypothetical protein
MVENHDGIFLLMELDDTCKMKNDWLYTMLRRNYRRDMKKQVYTKNISWSMKHKNIRFQNWWMY